MRSAGIVIVAVALIASTVQARAVQDTASARSGCSSRGQGLQEAQFVRIGAIEQWLTITGERCANPVVLFLHGGPGNTMSPYAAAVFASWQKHFTIVQWDQRGARRPYGRNPPAAGTRC